MKVQIFEPNRSEPLLELDGELAQRFREHDVSKGSLTSDVLHRLHPAVPGRTERFVDLVREGTRLQGASFAGWQVAFFYLKLIEAEGDGC